MRYKIPSVIYIYRIRLNTPVNACKYSKKWRFKVTIHKWWIVQTQFMCQETPPSLLMKYHMKFMFTRFVHLRRQITEKPPTKWLLFSKKIGFLITINKLVLTDKIDTFRKKSVFRHNMKYQVRFIFICFVQILNGFASFDKYITKRIRRTNWRMEICGHNL